MMHGQPDSSAAKREKVKSIFSQVLDLPVEERSDFLARACGPDEDLRRELLSLLESHEQTGDFLETSPLSSENLFPSHDSILEERNHAPGHLRQVGHYQILKVLGDGGMGTIYLAQQAFPVRRQVALKLINPGLDSRAVVDRFELERQALAIMNHPGIAQVYDAGSTENGQPYFVMEYVPGQPITGFCDHFQLSLDQRLELFIQVCHAIQHAHQKGIIHRDIKPTNILVSMLNEGPAPKIIDFGVARATSQGLVHSKSRTKIGMVVGTPEYMSPEQAETGAVDIDTRADIYALGVLLYELLVGQLPLQFGQEGEESFSDIQRIIRRQEPLRPSQRIDSLPEIEVNLLAEKRNTTPHKLREMLCGELDWITMKAMEKDRSRRYTSASELATDVNRHRQREPVLAGPPGTAYVLKKVISRHRFPLLAVLMVFLSLALGLAISMRLYVVAETAKRGADQLLGEYRNLADLFLLESYRQEAADLWPAWPDKIEEMNRWMEKADQLAGRLGFHRQELDELRRSLAMEYDEEARYQDRFNTPLAARLEDLSVIRSVWDEKVAQCAETAEVTDPSRLKEKLEAKTDLLIRKGVEIDREIADLAEHLATRKTWTFAKHEVQWLHDKLTRLVQELEEFTDPDPLKGTLANIRQRIELTRTLEEVSLEQYRERWTEAVHSIADPNICPQYEMLRIKPQVGLIPLGRDPDSGLWEFAVYGTGEVPERAPDGRLHLSGRMALVLVLIPGGTFQMGAVSPEEGIERLPNRDPVAWLGESPVHGVRLDPFFLSKFEMTNGQWRRGQEIASGSSLPPGPLQGTANVTDDLKPMENLDWQQCKDLLVCLGMDLPSEAQWEYAARAGTASIWYTGWSKQSIAGHANIGDFTAMSEDAGRKKGIELILFEESLDDGCIYTAPVGSYLPNPFGLHDIMGNVCEWCRDWFQLYDCPIREGDGERIVVDIDPQFRVLRGGHYQHPAPLVRMSVRIQGEVKGKPDFTGVRPMRPLVY